MAIIALAPGAETTRCPVCGGSMSSAVPGRRTARWFRHCLNGERCSTTTVTTDAPAGRAVVVHTTSASYRPASLPFARVNRPALERELQSVGVDVRRRAAGEREPGEDG